MPDQPTSDAISAEELARALEAAEPIQVLDVRAPFRLAMGKVEIGGRFLNVTGSEMLAMEDPSKAGLERSDPVAVVCGHGIDSFRVAEYLNKHGFVARSLEGGMCQWMQALLPRELEAPPGFDRLVQFDRVGKGALGYALVSGGEAMFIDPPREHGAYDEMLAETGAKLVAVADTHVHADYISGSPAIARAHGVPYYLHPADNVFPYDGTPGKLDITELSHDLEIKVGEGVVRAAHTPGHTEGHITFLVGEAAAFTGDFMFVDSIGRPDLAGKTEAWTQDLWQSVCWAKAGWPASIHVYPAHYTSEGERREDRSVWRRFGEVMESNEPLRIADAAEFTAWVGRRVSGPPEAYKQIKAINAGLQEIEPEEAEILEFGKSECALG